MTASEPRWLKFKDCAATRAAWLETSRRIPEDDKVWQCIFTKPVFRVLTGYSGNGMSLFALARVFQVEPREVWKQVRREAINTIYYCDMTGLLVVEAYWPWDGAHCDTIPRKDYDRESGFYTTAGAEVGLPSFEEMFLRFPLKKCVIDFNPWKRLVHRLSHENLIHFRKLNTLGLSPKKANAFLL